LRTLVAIGLGIVLSTCSTPPSVLEQIQKTGELKVVTRNTPGAFYYGPDTPRGIEYELARDYAERLGVSLRIYIDDDVLPAVASGEAEIGAASLTVTDTPNDAVEFGPGYQKTEPLVLDRRGTKRPRNLAELADGQLVVTASSPHASLLAELHETEPSLHWEVQPDVSSEELIRRVAEGSVDYTVADSHVFELVRHFYPEVRTAFSLKLKQDVAWTLVPDRELRESVAAYFAEIEATGELQDILDRYYFASREFDYVSSRAFIRHVDTRLPQYREYFQEAERSTGVDWRLLAAIAYQESHWNPRAVSPTGVRGMMMLTEHTASTMEVDDRHDARMSILGGAHYFVRLRRKVPERIAEPDRSWLAVAAYNLGYGHVEDARILTQIQGADPDRWTDVEARLPLLSDESWYRRVQRGYAPGQVAVTYVNNVRRYYEILMWLDSRDTLTTQEFLPPQTPLPAG
jgi:peptidoglycan lytic transglycosylase F